MWIGGFGLDSGFVKMRMIYYGNFFSIYFFVCFQIIYGMVYVLCLSCNGILLIWIWEILFFFVIIRMYIILEVIVKIGIYIIIIESGQIIFVF